MACLLGMGVIVYMDCHLTLQKHAYGYSRESFGWEKLCFLQYQLLALSLEELLAPSSCLQSRHLRASTLSLSTHAIKFACTLQSVEPDKVSDD